jgi:hypothetical protein
MIIVLILVVLWGVVLGPSIYRRIRSANSDRSIASFHRSLSFLERSGPKVVEPAYRLSDGENPLPAPQVARPQPQPRIAQPTLVLLGPDGQRGEEVMRDSYRDYYQEDEYGYHDDAGHDVYEEQDDERGYRYDDYDRRPSPFSRFNIGGEAVVLSRRDAARRRRSILFGLLGAIVVTALIGFFVSFFLYLTLLAAVALVAYIGLMAYAAKNEMFGEKGYDRHVARGVAPIDALAHDDEYYEERYHEPVASTRGHRDDFLEDEEFDDDGWWDQPRQAAAR